MSLMTRGKCTNSKPEVARVEFCARNTSVTVFLRVSEHFPEGQTSLCCHPTRVQVPLAPDNVRTNRSIFMKLGSL